MPIEATAKDESILPAPARWPFGPPALPPDWLSTAEYEALVRDRGEAALLDRRRLIEGTLDDEQDVLRKEWGEMRRFVQEILEARLGCADAASRSVWNVDADDYYVSQDARDVVSALLSDSDDASWLMDTLPEDVRSDLVEWAKCIDGHVRNLTHLQHELRRIKKLQLLISRGGAYAPAAAEPGAAGDGRMSLLWELRGGRVEWLGTGAEAAYVLLQLPLDCEPHQHTERMNKARAFFEPPRNTSWKSIYDQLSKVSRGVRVTDAGRRELLDREALRITEMLELSRV